MIQYTRKTKKEAERSKYRILLTDEINICFNLRDYIDNNYIQFHEEKLKLLEKKIDILLLFGLIIIILLIVIILYK